MRLRPTLLDFGTYLARFLADASGNTAVLAALIIPPLILSMGAALDYESAAHREERLNGIADSAALAAVTPAMMAQSDAIAKTTALTLFNSQSALVPNVGTVTPTVTIVDSNVGAQIVRTVTVHYTSTSNNVFSGVLGFNTMAIQGVAVSKSTLSPKTNFYLLIDTSPSMELPATTVGINWMVANTSGEGGCAFACHETNPTTSDTQGNAGGVDNYTLSRNACTTTPAFSIPLRIDLVNDAVNNLMEVAPATATANNTVYGMEIDTIDNVFDGGRLQFSYQATQSNLPLTTDYSGFQIHGNTKDGGCTITGIHSYLTISPLTMYSNNNSTQGSNDQDEDTHFDYALGKMSGIMPNPGNGTSNPNDTPKEVLFIVSDAMPDYDNSGRKYWPINLATNPSDGLNWCTSIKNRNIRIAFLYLTYIDLPATSGNSWYTNNVRPGRYDASGNDSVATAAQNCASPGLYFEVQTDGDITGALNALFQKAVATAFLST